MSRIITQKAEENKQISERIKNFIMYAKIKLSQIASK